jgi:outer membrane protein OmpA-like peptidoglycan-associated protein
MALFACEEKDQASTQAPEKPAKAANADAPKAQDKQPEQPKEQVKRNESMKIVVPSEEQAGVVSFSNGRAIEVLKGRMTERLVTALLEPEKARGQSFVLDQVGLDDGRFYLKELGGLQLNNLGAIIEAYPEMQWRIVSYARFSESEEENMAASNKWIEKIRGILEESGSELGAVEWEAFGSENPESDLENTDSRIVVQTF